MEKLHLKDLPRWEKQDIYTQLKSEMMLSETESTTIIINNFQASDDLDSDRTFYEVYESEIAFDIDDTLEEFENNIIRNEKLVREYKSMKALVNACIRKNSKHEYMTYNLLSII